MKPSLFALVKWVLQGLIVGLTIVFLLALALALYIHFTNAQDKQVTAFIPYLEHDNAFVTGGGASNGSFNYYTGQYVGGPSAPLVTHVGATNICISTQSGFMMPNFITGSQ